MIADSNIYQQNTTVFKKMSDNKQLQLPLLPASQVLSTAPFGGLPLQPNFLSQQPLLISNQTPVGVGNFMTNTAALLPNTNTLPGLLSPAALLSNVDLDKRWLQNVGGMQPVQTLPQFDSVYPLTETSIPQKTASVLPARLNQGLPNTLKRERETTSTYLKGLTLPLTSIHQTTNTLKKAPPKKKRRASARPCEMPNCKRLARSSTQYCAAHGGGLRCKEPGCDKAARGKSLLCIGHGGGKRCQTPNCTKSAQGATNHCIAHGGGKRCKHPSCNKSARAKEGFCKAHSVERRKTQAYPSN
mmetsp:Transcript_8926/g.10211  ORF Transcript_8926/g.10211 Transcript_8926/m.10211 type:complete len:300 (-) Transcript_8926:166-1065(-)